jgi:type IV pilus assembly protein PilO
MARNKLIVALWHANRGGPLLLVVALVLNLGLLAMVYAWQRPRLERLEATVLKRQAAQRRPGRNDGATSAPEQMAVDLDRFFARIAPYEGFPVFLSELYDHAAVAGLRIDRISYRPEREQAVPLLRYGLEFSVTGAYGQVKRFIHALEQSPRLIVLEEMALAGQEPARDRVTLRIELATFFKAKDS